MSLADVAVLVVSAAQGRRAVMVVSCCFSLGKTLKEVFSLMFVTHETAVRTGYCYISSLSA